MSLYRQILDLHRHHCRRCGRRPCRVAADLFVRVVDEAVAAFEYVPLPAWTAPGWSAIAAAAGQPQEGA